jgi:hypothetical protein
MVLLDKIPVFEKLGIFLNQFSIPDGNDKPYPAWLEELNRKFFQPVESEIKTNHIYNPWFTEENIRFAMGTTGRSLSKESLTSWLGRYESAASIVKPATIAVIMAGNIPLVGFHDMLCVLFSGHNLLAKLSARDDRLLKLVAEILYTLDPFFKDKIRFTQERIIDFNAVIATGSNNTSRYFEYYFGKYPHIIRGNRISVAILDGSETEDDLRALSNDVFRYFGLGCRSVSKIFVPDGYDFTPLIEAFGGYSHLADHNQWANNYNYQKAVHLIDLIPHLDTGFFLIRNNPSFHSPIGVLNYEIAISTGSALEIAGRNRDILQCVVGNPGISGSLVPFGKAQEPALSDYSDNVDTMDFLTNL